CGTAAPGHQPRHGKAQAKPLFGAAGSKVMPKDIAFFSRQMATMMKSGVPIVSALDIIASGHKNPRMKKMV
ncbi:type II secretion system F family protein, partial [Bacillus cereus]|uniref:type II secretion system F family protein n=1 Tax=Bacillus cereus TaxID=1396 RepID=UPI001E5C60F8